jgi:hypothetical protein
VTTFTVTQDGDYNTCSNWYISPASGYYSASSNSDYFNVYASNTTGEECGYYVIANDSWITTLYNSTSQLNFNINANTNYASRTGHIYVYVTCTNSLVATFTITQLGYGTGINTIDTSNNSILIYPNPANDQITIESASLNYKDEIISIYNIQGQLVKTFTAISNKTIVDISGFQSGLYFVKVKTDVSTEVRKFMKE